MPPLSSLTAPHSYVSFPDGSVACQVAPGRHWALVEKGLDARTFCKDQNLFIKDWHAKSIARETRRHAAGAGMADDYLNTFERIKE